MAQSGQRTALRRPIHDPAAWNDILKATERDNAPGSFTAFISFELMEIANIAASRPKDKSMLATE
jgi:hypothetical protein